jgi:16S rRNA C967 or C1407 C5-methylase (RsmB/RsmF family)/NOL1/NOP2/fmu family ribosome biogenesis protein
LATEFPQEFIIQIRKLFGAASEFFLESLTQPPATSIRYNSAKPTQLLEHAKPVEWSSTGYELPTRPDFIFDPLWHAGTYYVQESSSMFLEHIVKHIRPLFAHPIVALDVCAAPGGKSLVMASAMQPNDVLVSNEVIKSRVAVLQENIIRWGGDCHIITQNDPNDFASVGPLFDLVLVDAPCSGEGLFRRDANAINEWSEASVQLCAGRQQRILRSIWDNVKPGGYLIYATCTFNEIENEQIVQWLQTEGGFKSFPIPFPKHWPIAPSLHNNVHGYRFLPHLTSGEGLFIACLQKHLELPAENNKSKNRVNKWDSVSKSDLPELQKWLQQPSQYAFVKQQQFIHALPIHLASVLEKLHKPIYIKHAGITMGTLMNGELLPDHTLALSAHQSQHIPSVNVSLEDAIRYLRKDTVHFTTEHKGWNLIRFEGHALGWVKVLPNRTNNYLPASYRILKSYPFTN